MAIATAPVKLLTVSPDASRAATVTAGVIATPTCVVPGCTPNARCVAGGGGAAVMLNALLVAGVSVMGRALCRERVPTLSIVRFANVDTPFTAFTGALPVNVPPTGLLSMAIETAPVKLVTVLPDASSAATVTAGVIVAPTCAPLGCTPNARCVAGGGGAAVMLNALLVAGVSVPDVAVSV